MGGGIALTIRFSNGAEWRGSCWTNILPQGLFAAEFYDPEQSEIHTKAWLEELKKHRSDNPELEEIYGGHNKLAPLEYGLIVVDYKDKLLVSCNGYCHVDTCNVISSDDKERLEKFVRLCELHMIDADKCVRFSSKSNPKSIVTEEWLENYVSTIKDVLAHFDEDEEVIWGDKKPHIEMTAEEKTEYDKVIERHQRTESLIAKINLRGTTVFETIACPKEEALKHWNYLHNLIAEHFVLSADEQASWEDYLNERKTYLDG